MSDLIERDEAIAKTFCTDVDGVPRMAVLLDDIKAIPSARPKEGKWMEAGRMTQFNKFYYFRYCSKCFYARDDCDSEKDTNFCPNCGADMRERKDFQVIVNGNCTKCGKPLSGNRIFICEECEEQNKESE